MTQVGSKIRLVFDMPNFSPYNLTIMMKGKCCPLNKCRRGRQVQIIGLGMHRRLAHRCCELGLGIGNTIEVLESAGDVIIAHNGHRLSLNESMAQDILVEQD